MKIAIIQNFFNPYIIGGAEINVESFVYSLVKREIETILITSRENKKMEVFSPCPHLKIYRFNPFNLYFNYPPQVKRNRLIKILWWIINLWNPFVFFKVRKVLKMEKSDLVNVRNFYTLSPSVFLAAKSLRIPILYTAHDFFPLCKNSSFMKNGRVCWKQCFFCRLWAKWNKFFLKDIKFMFLSNFSADLYKKYFKVSGNVLHNPVYLSQEEIVTNMELKKNRQHNFDKIVFLFLGRLARHKGILTLLKAFEMVKEQNINLLIGGDGELIEEIKSYALKDSRIKYLGFVSREKKKHTLLHSDVLVFPSEWFEVSPLTIQEAHGFGLSVIGTNLGSIPEHIDVDKTGWIFPYRDVSTLAQIIEKLGKDKEKIRKTSKKCFEKALKNTSSKYVEKMIQIYSKII